MVGTPRLADRGRTLATIGPTPLLRITSRGVSCPSVEHNRSSPSPRDARRNPRRRNASVVAVAPPNWGNDCLVSPLGGSVHRVESRCWAQVRLATCLLRASPSVGDVPDVWTPIVRQGAVEVSEVPKGYVVHIPITAHPPPDWRAAFEDATAVEHARDVPLGKTNGAAIDIELHDPDQLEAGVTHALRCIEYANRHVVELLNEKQGREDAQRVRRAERAAKLAAIQERARAL